MMDQLIADFPNHLEQAIQIGNAKKFHASPLKIENVLICGLGGSGIGGTIASQLLSKEANCPIMTNKNYNIPTFINENSLVICCSYSGNTEETINMYQEAQTKNAQIVIISSGGKLIDSAKENKHNYIQIPAGFPPRAAFGLSFPQLLQVLSFYDVVKHDYVNELKTTIQLLKKEEENIKSTAKKIATQLLNKIAVIYSDAAFEGVAIRFRQQINENAKMLCWHHAIPEMNHNELVGWKKKNNSLAVIVLRSPLDYYTNQKRIDYCIKNIFSEYTNTIIEIRAKGDNLLINSLYHIHLGDWVSYYLADLQKIDPVEVNAISGLKNFLAQL